MCGLSIKIERVIFSLMIGDVKRVYVGMSGGVDSSVAAYLLKTQGYDVSGVYLKCYVRPDKSCMKEAMDAKRVAEILDIPFEIWDFEKEYKKRVIDYMIGGYKKGLTPNPDILCNKEIKFGLFLEEALKRGADYVATGHYVRLRRTETKDKRQETSSRKKRLKDSNTLVPDNLSLFTARDVNKDQSYFLWTLTQEQLKHALFPIGDYLKPEVRAIAKKAGLPVHDKKDSQGICFLGLVKLEDFLAQYIKPKSGKVELFSKGGTKEIGRHQGAHLYTIGQRRGIGNVKHEKGVMAHEPLYVTGKDVKTNTVTVARKEEADTVSEVELVDVNFIDENFESRIKNDEQISVLVRTRYRQTLVGACIMYHVARSKKSKNAGEARLVFDEPQRFIAAGQSAVFYSEAGELIGGGVIR